MPPKVFWLAFFFLFLREDYLVTTMQKETFEVESVSSGSAARVIDFEMVFGDFREYRSYFLTLTTNWSLESLSPGLKANGTPDMYWLEPRG